ncbi:DUF6248 family natural product biosynthesis protein [Streptomyces sp. G1]|uniref:DUF6248 family natural product biosynthesis protein n=1 Tax=Streptomyces sp. G1 TaxID=361572 RepID=UPI00202EADB1|nr:DUF6248 family natural product biosynthesis protein [Streptomyces sp. G1]MCM1973188.1 DUF6248 family natural product biosynthesis protein [Streptomyces sp. G1]
MLWEGFEAAARGFHRWCACEAGTYHACRIGHHGRCISRNGPRIAEHAGTVVDRGGFVVAVIQYGPGQRPWRWNCPCTHPADTEQTAVADSYDRPPVAPGPAAENTDGQLSLFGGRSLKDADRERP